MRVMQSLRTAHSAQKCLQAAAKARMESGRGLSCCVRYHPERLSPDSGHAYHKTLDIRRCVFREFTSPAMVSPSSTDSDVPHEEPDIKQKILEAALMKVPRLGWTQEALAEGAQDVGLSAAAHGIFSRGGLDLVAWVYEQRNRKFTEKFPPRDLSAKKSPVPLKRYLADAIRHRLFLDYEKTSETWSSALALLALPQNSMEAVRLVNQTMDDMWYLSGDHAVDSNWYAKRAVLGSVYQATELHMLQDQTSDKQATWEFLDRQMNAFDALHGTVTKVQQPFQYFFPFCRAAATTTQRVPM